MRDKRRKKRCALAGGSPTRGAADKSTGGRFLSAPSIPQDARQFKTHAPPRDGGLIDALERARAAYWTARDRRDYSQADAHAGHYRALLRRAFYGPSLDAWLRHFNRVMLEQERRLDALERGEVLGQGGGR